MIYTGRVRLDGKIALLAMLLTLAFVGAGCSGINASKSVSPLDFLMPGAGSFLKANPASTNAPVLLPEIQIVSVK